MGTERTDRWQFVLYRRQQRKHSDVARTFASSGFAHSMM